MAEKVGLLASSEAFRFLKTNPKQTQVANKSSDSSSENTDATNSVDNKSQVFLAVNHQQKNKYTKAEILKYLSKFSLSLSEEEDSKFQAYMKSVIQDLIPEHDWSKESIRFVLDAREGPNGYYINLGKGEHIIGITKENFSNQSLLYWLVGHEYGHLKARVKGIKENSKAEEAYADSHLLEQMEELGLDASIAMQVFRSSRESDINNILFQSILDVHPLETTRLGIIDTILGGISHVRGGLNIETNRLKANDKEFDLTNSLIEQAFKNTEVKIESELSKPATKLFNELELVHKEIQEVSQELKQHEQLNESEKRTLINRLSASLFEYRELKVYTENILDPDSKGLTDKHQEIKAEAKTCLNILLNNYQAFITTDQMSEVHFGQFLKMYARAEMPKIDLGNIKENIDSFCLATEDKEIEEAAKKILEAYTQHEKLFRNQSDGLRSINKYDQNAFNISTRHEMIKEGKLTRDLPWARHIEALKSNPIPEIRDTLLLLGIIDKDLYEVSLNELAFITDRPQLSTSSLMLTNRNYEHAIVPESCKEGSDINLTIEIIDNNNRNQKEQYESICHAAAYSYLGEQLAPLANETYLKALETKDPNEKELLIKHCQSLVSYFYAPLTLTVRFNSTDKLIKSLGENLEIPIIGLDYIEKDIDLFFVINEAEEVYSKSADDIIKKLNELCNEGKQKEVNKILTKILNRSIFGLGYDYKSESKFINFIYGKPDLFTDEEKATLIGLCDYYEYNSDDISIPAPKEVNNTADIRAKFINYDNGELDLIRGAFSCGDVENYDELLKRLEFIKSLDNEDPNGRIAKIISIWIAAEISEAIEVLENDTETIPLVDIINLCPETALKFDDRLRNNISDWLDELDFKSTEIDKAIHAYTKLSQVQLINNLEHEDQLIKNLVEKIPEEQNLSLRLNTIETLMSSSANEWPEIRSLLNQYWIEIVIELSNKNEDQILESVDKVLNKINKKDAYTLISSLADSLQTQEELSIKLGQLIEDHLINSVITANQASVGVIEGIKELANRNHSFRESLLNYLYSGSQKLSEEMDKQFLEAYKINAHVNFMGRGLFNVNDLHKFKQEVPKVRQRLYELFRMNFWNSSIPARAAALKDIMMPFNHEQSGKDAFFWGSVAYVVKKLIPGGEPYAQETRNTLFNFCKILPNRERDIFLASVFAAAEENKNNSPSNVGQRLATLLSMMGPATIKLGQAIHSFDRTPEDIRSGMEIMKSNVDSPTRWNLFKLLNKTLPDSLKSRIKSVEERLGAASYYYVYKVTLDDGKEYALALLKPYAKERSERGFEHLRALVQEFKKEGKSSEYLTALEELIEQSYKMASIETDSESSKLQEEQAKTLYSDQTITINDREFNISIANSLELDTGYRLMELAPGQPFNELAKENTDPEWLHDFSLAYHSFELKNMLSGNLFDEDRHGEQMNIESNSATLYDFGAISLEQAAPDELFELGQLIADFYKELQNNKTATDLGESLAQTFSKSITERKDAGKTPHYLVSINRAWLALGDYRKNFRQEDYKDMLISVLKSGSVNEKVLEGFYSSLSTFEAAKIKLGLQAIKAKIKFKTA